MKRAVAALLLPLLVFAQDVAPVPASQQGAPEFVIHINVNLVQVDAVVTDSNNRPVTDLKAEDFEIQQDGKPQAITTFSYVSATALRSTAIASQTRDQPKIPGPPPAIKPKEVRRAMALVVDDLGLSFESTAYVHLALKKFVDEQMQPGDLVAIVRTGAGIGALQQFTSDKRMLYAAIERIRFNAFGRTGISSFTPLASGQRLDNGIAVRNSAAEAAGLGFDQSLEDVYAAGSLGAVRYVVEGLRDLPGRKSLILFSENIPILGRQGANDLVIESLRRLTDAAERSAVVIYTIDPRGLPVLGLTAADDTKGMSSLELTQATIQRSRAYSESQDGLAYLARETGGLFVHDTNDLAGGIKRVLEDASGYYLIGYRPSAGTFDPNSGERKFHTVKVRVKRPGLRVRSRNGFFGFQDRERKFDCPTRELQIAHALASPFSSSDIQLRLTTLFANWDKGSFLTSLLHVDGRNLAFTNEPDGSHNAVVEVVAVTFGDDGKPIGTSERSYTVHVKPDNYTNVLRNGFIFTLQHKVKQSGAYQMRVVLRDTASQKLGSASQFIEVPNLKQGHLALSGIMLAADSPKPANSEAAPQEHSEQASDPTGNAAIRIFRPGTTLAYEYQILNARFAPATSPQLTAQVHLFHDGKELYTGKPANLDFTRQNDMKRLMAGGLLQLGREFEPGDYVLQIVVADNLAGQEKYRTASQWMNFEVE